MELTMTDAKVITHLLNERVKEVIKELPQASSLNLKGKEYFVFPDNGDTCLANDLELKDLYMLNKDQRLYDSAISFTAKKIVRRALRENAFCGPGGFRDDYVVVPVLTVNGEVYKKFPALQKKEIGDVLVARGYVEELFDGILDRAAVAMNDKLLSARSWGTDFAPESIQRAAGVYPKLE
jgi:hypothetical protein